LSPFVPLPDGVQVEIVYALGGEIVENRLWFWTDFPPYDFAAVQGLADGVLSWHTTYILPYLSSDITLVDVEAKSWEADPPSIVAVAPANIAGGFAGESQSANVAASVAFKWTNDRMRRRKNKNFVPGIPEAEITLNDLSPFMQDILYEGYAALIDAARTWYPFDFWWWVVTSAWLDGALRSEQLFRKAQGPVTRDRIRIGQRRKRLPV